MKLTLLKTLIDFGGRLPAHLLYLLADLAGLIAWMWSPGLRAVTRDHMDHMPGLAPHERARDRAARGCLRSAARYWADLARTAHLPATQAVEEYVRWTGLEHLFEAWDRGHGVVLVSAHVGAPEFAIRIASHIGLDVIAVVERNPADGVNEVLQRVRRPYGAEYVEPNRGGMRRALEHLRCGGVVALIADRDLQGTGSPLPFFGERTTLPSGPVELALRAGAPLVPCVVLREGVGRYSIEFAPPVPLPRTHRKDVDMDAAMLLFARALESIIRKAPEQWFALQPIWRGLPGRAGAGSPKMTM